MLILPYARTVLMEVTENQQLSMVPIHSPNLYGLLRSKPTVSTPSKERMGDISVDAHNAPIMANITTTPMSMSIHQALKRLSGR
jgi:hypothetical protein